MSELNKQSPAKRKGGPGRPKGSVNRATADVRAAIANLMELSAPKMIGWLERIAVDDPAKAFDLTLKAAEYHIPKLARTEVTGKDGADFIPPVVTVNLVKPE